MTDPALALAGWLVGVGALAGAVVQLRARRNSVERVLRACHELRGPITAARLAVALGARTGELSTGPLRALDLELEHASLALNDLAAVATRREPTPVRGEFDLGALAIDCAEAWKGAARAREVELKVAHSGGGPTVLGDWRRVGQAIGNLLANAIEHGGGVVRLRASSTGGLARVEVSDDGPGLPAPVAELTRNARRRRSTRGRGLAIAAAIAEAHGGRLAAAPTERGAKVVLELPTAVAGRATAAAEDGSTGRT